VKIIEEQDGRKNSERTVGERRENGGKTVGKPEPWKPGPYVKLVKHLIDVRGQCGI
jgi:hypothetical protein